MVPETSQKETHFRKLVRKAMFQNTCAKHEFREAKFLRSVLHNRRVVLAALACVNQSMPL